VCRKGFTLLELVVAMAIVMILVTIAVQPLDRYVARVRLRFAGMTLVQDLRDMQANAVCEDSFYTMVFVTNENRYLLQTRHQVLCAPWDSQDGEVAEQVRRVSAGGRQKISGLGGVRFRNVDADPGGHHELQFDGQTGWDWRRACDLHQRVW